MKITKILIKIISGFSLFGSELMKLFLRMNGAIIGKNSFVSFSSRLVSKKIIIGNDVRILEQAKIKASEINIGSGCIISANCFISGKKKIFVGDKTYLGKKVRIDLNEDVTIGKDVGVGENTVIWTHGYFPPADEGYPVTYAPVVIQDGAWVSTNIILLPGVNIGKNVIIGAGSVVTKSVLDEMIIAGNPAKVIKEVAQIKNNKSFIEIITEIIAKYDHYKLVKNSVNKNTAYFFYEKFVIHIMDGVSAEMNKVDSKTNIFFVKNAPEEFYSKLNGFEWFNFNTKITRPTKNKFALGINEFLVGYGLRFLYKY